MGAVFLAHSVFLHCAAPRSVRSGQVIIVIHFDLLVGNKHLRFFVTEAKENKVMSTGRF